MKSEAYTIVVTSCDRDDLLRRTLDSLIEHLDVPPEKIIIIEDSGKEPQKNAIPVTDIPVELIINKENLGQMRSIDRAYERVETPMIFHCEEDWEFFRTGFIKESQKLLDAYPEISMVSLRPRSELNTRVRNAPVEWLGEVAYLRMDPSLHPEYFGYCFNPGLRRLSDYQRFAPLEKIGHEADVSYQFKKHGFQMACLENPAVRHIGDKRHVDGPKGRTKKPIKLVNSIRKRAKRIKRLFMPSVFNY